MSEDNDRGKSLNDQKKVAFYSAVVDAWVQTRMERDKQLLVLSTLAIGFLMVFYQKFDSICFFVVWLVDCLMFIVAIILILVIFSKNADYLVALYKEDKAKKESMRKQLSCFDTIVSVLFVTGIVLALIIMVVKSGFIVINVGGVVSGG